MSLLDALLLDPYRINIWIAKRTDGIAGIAKLLPGARIGVRC